MDHRKGEGFVLRGLELAAAGKLTLAAAAFFCFLFVSGTLAASAQDINVSGIVAPSSTLTLPIEESFRWYANTDAIDPTSPLAAEGARIDTPAPGSDLRLRMNIENIGGVSLAVGATFDLQYADATSGPWSDVGGSGAAWGFASNPSVPDGSIISTLLLASSTVGESYGASNPSAASPYAIASSSYGEWDWSLASVAASTTDSWFFRMIDSSGTLLSGYASYPELTAVPPPPPSGGGGGGGVSVGVGPGVGTGGPARTSSAASSTPAAPSSATPPSCGSAIVGDFDCDGRIDIVDLSILLYYYHRSGREIARYDLNHDGRVDFADVSILMYYWTGT